MTEFYTTISTLEFPFAEPENIWVLVVGEREDDNS